MSRLKKTAPNTLAEAPVCCDVMAGQLNYDCPEHGTDCPDVVVRRRYGGELRLQAANAAYELRFCPWCGTAHDLPTFAETLAYLEAHRDWHWERHLPYAVEWCGPDDSTCSTLMVMLLDEPRWPATEREFVAKIISCVQRVDGEECDRVEAIRRIKEKVGV